MISLCTSSWEKTVFGGHEGDASSEAQLSQQIPKMNAFEYVFRSARYSLNIQCISLETILSESSWKSFTPVGHIRCFLHWDMDSLLELLLGWEVRESYPPNIRPLVNLSDWILNVYSFHWRAWLRSTQASRASQRFWEVQRDCYN